MRIKNKKTILKIIMLGAIASAIVSLFVPNVTFDYLDVLKKNGNEYPEVYCKIEYSPLIIHFVGYNYEDGENPIVYDRYKILYGLIKTESGKGKGIHFSGTTDYDITNSDNLLVSKAGFDFLTIVGLIFFLVLFSYFCYKIFREDEYNTRYLLYESLLLLVIVIGYPISIYYSYYIIDINNMGFIDSLIFGYGFYLMIVSTVLFFISYLLKKHFFDIKEAK